MPLIQFPRRSEPQVRTRSACAGCHLGGGLDHVATPPCIGRSADSTGRVYFVDVLELDVVTGGGQLFSCSVEKDAELFNMVLAGLGQADSCCATRGPRNRRRPSLRMRLRCANSISTRFRSRQDCSKVSVPASARTTSRASSKRNFEVVEAREDGQLVAAAAEPLGGPEFRTNGVLGPWHDL